MASPTSYKVVTCKPQELEAQLNDLSLKGWKVVTATYLHMHEKPLVILEKP
jgi:hypothetical protein